MKRLLETIELTSNSQKGAQVIWTDDSSHGRDVQREPMAVEQIFVAPPLPAHVWHCSDYDF